MAKILVIEDDVDERQLILAWLRQHKFETEGRADAISVLRDLEAKTLTCDAIISDLNLPGISGIEFIRKLRMITTQIPVILVTGTNNIEIAIEAMEAGAHDFVVKPLHFPQLLISVERGIYLSKHVDEGQATITPAQMDQQACLSKIVGESPAFRRALNLAKRVANNSANVLIMGESGSGKEVIAQAVHYLGNRAKAPFVAINCSAIPENLLESELFGYARGAFTGAVGKKVGLFEEADGGTLFLDEIGDMSLFLQAKLLRVLQERKIKRVGENQMRNIDVRVIAATHKDLKKEVAEGRFREDLFFRLDVIPIMVPPMRDRKEDVMPLAHFFLKKFCAAGHCVAKGFSKAAEEVLLNHPWTGNVRELENTIERAVVLCQKELIEPEDLREFPTEDARPSGAGKINEVNLNLAFGDRTLTADQLVKLYIKYVLAKNNGAKDKTAKDLDIDRKTLYRKLQEMQADQNT